MEGGKSVGLDVCLSFVFNFFLPSSCNFYILFVRLVGSKIKKFPNESQQLFFHLIAHFIY